MILQKIKLYGKVIAVAIFSVLAIFGATMKGQRDRARAEADTAKAVVHAERVKRKIVKEEKEKLSQEESIIKEKIEKFKEGEEFEGLDNLSDPNNFDAW